MTKALVISLESPYLMHNKELNPWHTRRMLMFPATSVLIATCIRFWGEKHGMEAELFCLDEAVRKEFYSSGVFSAVDGVIEKLLKARLSKSDYDLFCIVAPYTIMANKATYTAGLIRRLQPESVIITGGPHATFTASQIIGNGNIDAVVMGPGEAKIKHIIEHFNKPERFCYPGICSRENPEPFSMAALSNDCEIPAMNLDFIDSKEFSFSYAGVIAGRGCSNACRYCLDGYYWHKARIPYYESAPRVKREMQNFADKGIPVRGLLDNQFDLRCPHFKSFCEQSLKGMPKINIFSICVNINSISREGCRIFRDCGGRALKIGLEVANSQLLSQMGKSGLPKDEVLRILDMIHEEGLLALGFFLFGYPGETTETCRQTVDFIGELHTGGRLDFVEPAIFIPYPGLPMYQDPQKFGVLPRPEWKNWDNWDRYVIPPYDLQTMKAEEIHSYWQQCKTFPGIRTPVF